MATTRTGSEWFSSALSLGFLLAALVVSCSSSGGGAFVSRDAGADCGGRTGNPCGDGAKCSVAGDCQSGICLAGACTAPPPGCNDGMRDNLESDVDCGGGACPACVTGKICVAKADCASDVCTVGTCSAPTASDGVKNDGESDIDCGGGLQPNGQPNPTSDGAPTCVPGKACLLASDCMTGVCAAMATTEGHPHGADAGKGAPAPGKGGALVCQAPSADDNVKNGSETDVDCGGDYLSTGDRNPASDGAPACGHGKACLVGTDCLEKVCNDNHDKGGGPVDCPEGKSGCTCQVPWANDGAHNDGETDVDCGGGATLGSDGAPPCAPYLHCTVPDDCTSHVCTGGICQPPSCTDLVKNGEETDIDCGGTMCPGCAVGNACKVSGDCATKGCNYKNICVGAPSCVVHNGGDTCGPGESDQGVTTNEDCCLGAAVTASHGTVILDKYRVTSGRMRAFLSAVKGNVRGFIQQQRALGFMAGATMDPSWDLFLPTAMDGCDVLGNCGADEISDFLMQDVLSGSPAIPTLVQQGPPFQGVYTSAYRWLGSTLFNGQDLPQQGCNIGGPGTHTYWMDPTTQMNYFGDAPAEQPQSLYDTKAQNCVPYLMAQSFCIWDGGRLEFVDEYNAALGVTLVQTMLPMPWGGGGPMPFAGKGTTVGAQYKFPTATDATLQALAATDPVAAANAPPAGQSIEYANFAFSYEYPDLTTSDYVVFISAPGRLLGRGPYGHADLIGDGMEVASDLTTAVGTPSATQADWTANGSFEGHPWGFYGWAFSLVNRYGKQGLRCARPAQ